MASTDLVFSGAPLVTGDLVFGDDGSDPTSDAVISGSIAVAMPVLSGQVVLGIVASGAIAVSMPVLSGEVIYNSDTQRPLVAQVAARWQDADPLAGATGQKWQDSQRQPVGFESGYQDAVPMDEAARAAWRDAKRTPNAARVRFQEGVSLPRAAVSKFQTANRTPNATRQRFENGLPISREFDQRFQDAMRGIAGQHRTRYQDAVPLSKGWINRAGSGKAVNRGWSTRYQEGVQPRPGITDLHPVEPPVEPCYLPSGVLVFETPWSADTNLVFICERHTPPQPGETIVVPIREVYMVLNEVTLRRVEGDIMIPTVGMSMTLDVDSYTWFFSANVPASAKQYVERNEAGDPVEVEAVVNGVAYRLLVESLTRDRTFGKETLRIGGRGLSATLDSPFAPNMNFGNTESRTAQQLMGDVLTLNGVPLDWAVDWQIEDWVVPGSIWTQQGSYIAGLRSIVGAVGGYLQPVPSAKTLRALLRYPTAPWAWGDVTPDFELPSAVTTREGIEWIEKARYNRVFVSGIKAGVTGQVTRAGTDGGIVAPGVTDSLIVDAISARQRGLSILADTGRFANVSLRLPVLEETGVIPPGKFVRYVDGATTRIGITRGVSVDISMPEVFQTLLVETHE